MEFVGEVQKDDKASSIVNNGDIQLVYISPESLLNTNLVLIVILSIREMNFG